MSSTLAATDARTAPSAQTHERRFLPEVQALRALAVGLVVIYHLHPSSLPGGFIGVDVFFVISGYLITGHMLREATSTGRLKLSTFWSKRARRILPASLLTILAVVVTAPFVFPVSQWSQLARQSVASVFYVENWVLASDSVDYLASDNVATPFQHFWSLAVEEQFYLLWPLLVAGTAWLVFRRRRSSATTERGVRIGLAVVFAAVVALSFVWNLIRVGSGDAAAYFTTTTRLWELGVGGTLAVLLRYTDRWRTPRTLLAVGGLAAIVVGAFALDGATPFPGAAALLPVLGTAAVIAAGRTGGIGSLTPVVDLPPVQWLGNVSYSLYLWHFPVVVYFVTITGHDPRAVEVVPLLLLALLLAWLSYRFVEQPVRRTTRLRAHDGRTLALAGSAMAVVAAATLVLPFRASTVDHSWQARADDVSTAVGSGFGAESTVGGTISAFTNGTHDITPNPRVAGDDLGEGRKDDPCFADPKDAHTPECTVGDTTSSKLVVLVGDSHARMYETPVVDVAKQRGWKVVTFLHSSCPFTTKVTTAEQRKSIRCSEPNAETLKRILALKPQLVVTSALATTGFVSKTDSTSAFADGLAGMWNELESADIPVIALKDVPRPRADVVDCVAQHYTDPQKCARDKSAALAKHDVFERAAKKAPGTKVVDMTDRFCDSKLCYAVIGNVAVYRDKNHVTETYATSLQTDIAKGLPEKLP